MVFFSEMILALATMKDFGARRLSSQSAHFFAYTRARVVSLIVSAVIISMLLVHYFKQFLKRSNTSPTETQREIRIAGRHFMLQTTLFVGTIGLLALYMSRLVP